MEDPTPDLIQKLITHQREAELSFCACAMMDAEAAREQAGYLAPEELLDLELREYWRKLVTGGDGTEIALDCNLFFKLSRRNEEIFYSAATPGSFAKTIMMDAYLRKIADHNNKLAGLLVERDIDQVREKVNAMAQALPAINRHYPDAGDQHLEFVAGMSEDSHTLPTGLRPLDNAFGGWDTGIISILAARPSMGKTSIGFQFAEHQAQQGEKAVYFSLEMKRRQLWTRRVCGLMELDPKVYKSRTFTQEQADRLAEVSEEYAGTIGDRLRVIDDVPLDMAQIWQTVAELRPRFVVIDHLGLVKHSNPNEVNGLHDVAWAGKQMAKQFDCHVMFLYQLNRGTEGRDDKRPGLSDLRGSGRLEEDGDLIAFLYRDDYYKKDEVPPVVSETEFIVEKNRDGVMSQRVYLEYHLKRQMFYAKSTTAQAPGGRK
jgi:replicative DNA helicase